MIVTETQASGLICPFARSFDASENTIAKADPSQETPVPYCLASRCMSWDWVDPETYLASQSYYRSQSGAGELELPKMEEGESKDDYDARCKAEAEAQGWTLNVIAGRQMSPQTPVNWKREFGPNRRGQCQRCLTFQKD